jgi:hypothetical protein
VAASLVLKLVRKSVVVGSLDSGEVRGYGIVLDVDLMVNDLVTDPLVVLDEETALDHLERVCGVQPTHACDLDVEFQSVEPEQLQDSIPGGKRVEESGREWKRVEESGRE